MIQALNMTPKVYYEHSRDFQFISRLFDVILNYIKTNVDLLETLPISDLSSEKLLDLMAMTCGFKSKHNYNTAQLKAVCKSFALILRNKGNIMAIKDACYAVISAEGIAKEPYIEINYDEKNHSILTLRVFVPNELSDLNLLYDILDYILPAGVLCNIVRSEIAQQKTVTEIVTADKLSGTGLPDYAVSRLQKDPSESAQTGADDTKALESIDINKPSHYPSAFVNTTLITSKNAYGTNTERNQEENT